MILLPHNKPPPMEKIGPLELAEKNLTKHIPPVAHRNRTFHFWLYTTALNQARHKLQQAIRNFQNTNEPNHLREYKNIRNTIRMEQKRLQSKRQRAEDIYWQSLPPSKWAQQIKPLIRGSIAN